MLFGRAGCPDIQRPADVSGRRWITEPIITRLIVQLRGDFDCTGRHAGSDLELHANRKLVLEDGERLRLADLFEIGRLWKHDLRRVNAGGRIDRQDGWNECRIARCVRLDVKTFGKRDEQSRANRTSWPACGFDNRRDVGTNAAQLCERYRRRKKQERKRRSESPHGQLG